MPTEELLTNTRPLTSARSTARLGRRRSPGPRRRCRCGRPRSLAKWLSVPSGSTPNSTPLSASIAATVPTVPSPPPTTTASSSPLCAAALACSASCWISAPGTNRMSAVIPCFVNAAARSSLATPPARTVPPSALTITRTRKGLPGPALTPPPCAAERVGDHRHRAQRHGGRCDHRAEQQAEERDRARRPRSARRRVVDEGEEQVLADVAHRRRATAAAPARCRARSPFTSVTPALSIATSVPVPMAMPTSAAASAGASLTPSPAIATTRPSLRSRWTTRALLLGQHLGLDLVDAELAARPPRPWCGCRRSA